MGNRIVIPHIIIIIKRVCIIGEVGAIRGDMLRHLLIFTARAFVEEELLIMVG